MNWPLFSMMYSIAATVLTGVVIVIALVTGFNEIPHIITVAVACALLSIPLGLYFTKKIGSITGEETYE
jgi:type IV secretory pathway protease TraF